VGIRSTDWLTHMQKDGAFEDIVYSFTVDPSPRQREEARQEMRRMASEISEGRETMRRSACFRYAPCPMASVCHGSASPQQAGWREKAIPESLCVVS
jgi:hypothetical protein